MPTSRFHGGTAVTSLPSTRIAPRCARLNPAMRRSSVDLPQPDGPSRAKNSPGSTTRSMFAQHLGPAERERDVARFDSYGGAHVLRSWCACARRHEAVREVSADRDDDDCDDAERRARSAAGDRLHVQIDAVGHRREAFATGEQNRLRDFDRRGDEARDEAGERSRPPSAARRCAGWCGRGSRRGSAPPPPATRAPAAVPPCTSAAHRAGAAPNRRGRRSASSRREAVSVKGSSMPRKARR